VKFFLETTIININYYFQCISCENYVVYMFAKTREIRYVGEMFDEILEKM
jgi:hypothetical protein